MADTLKKIGNTASGVVSKLKSILPDENEQQALREKQQQIDSTLAPAQTPAMQPQEPSVKDKVNPLARYGSRPGEKRIDTSDMTKPLTPVYDNGGDVSVAAGKHAQAEGDARLNSFLSAPASPTYKAPTSAAPTSTLGDAIGDLKDAVTTRKYNNMKKSEGINATPSYMPRTSEQKSASTPAPVAPTINITPGQAPVYDNGGDVKVPMHELGGKLEENDDHKMTIKAGPLKPEDYLSRYGSEAAVANRPDIKKPDVGMKAIPLYDEGGYVDVNDGKHQVAVLQDGERVLTPDEAEQYRSEHPEAAKPTEETTKQPTEVATNTPTPKLSRLGGSVESPKPTEEAQEKPVEEKPKLTYGHILADNWLKSNGMPSVVDMLKAPKEFNQGTPEPKLEVPTGTSTEPTAAPQGPMKPIVQPPPLDHKATVQKYDTQIQAALDTGTPEGHEKALLLQEAKQQYLKSTPWGSATNHPGILGKIGHVAEMVASRAPVSAPIMATIPGSEGYRAGEHAATEASLPQAEAAVTARGAEEAKANTEPKLLGGEGNTAVAPDGTRYQRYEMQDHTARWAKEGEVPTMASPGIPPTGAKQEGAAPAAETATPTIGNQPNLAAHPAVTTLPAGTVVGKPTPPKEGEQPASAAQVADVNTRLKNNPYVSPKAAADLQFPEGFKPTQNDVKERLANIKEIEDATRAGKQDEVMNSLRKMQEENQKLMTQAHLADMEDKHKQAEAKESMNASVSLAGLYAQENYRDEMKNWYASGNFAKDSGLVTEIVNKEHSDKGAFSSVLGDSLVGSLFGPEGTAIGAGVGALTGLLAGPANGYLDTLKKQGISQEGYDAMQSYFNALPARMAYEISVQGVSASAMRSQQLIQKVLNTIPPPNTPQESFKENFNRYYTPMKVLTDKKVELTAPKGYTPPKKEDLYPSKEAPKPKGTEVPREGNAKFHVGNAKGEIFSNDGKTWYDAQGKLIKNK